MAIELTDEFRGELKSVQSALGRSCEGVRWVRAEQLHLTVKFLGEVRDGDVPSVAEAVARSAARSASFEMELTDCGCFPPRGPVRIVWVGTRDPSERFGPERLTAEGLLMGCVNAVEQEMEAIGFPKESRPFSAHLTIGRAADGRRSSGIRAAVERQSVKPVRQSVDELTLMSSVLSPKGPSYSVISKARLGQITNPSGGAE